MNHARLILLLSTTLACSLPAMTGTAATQNMLNADLSKWNQYLGTPEANPSDTWSVHDGVVECTGKPNGYLRSKESFSNYTLHVEWRWTGEPGNSGVLLHIAGKDAVWPTCIESQLMNGNAGDIYHIGGTTCEELKEGRRIQKLQPSNEKAPGEWNEMDVTCLDDTITIRVNGLAQNQATRCSVTSGNIGLQSEGKPIAFRNVTITPIEK